MDKTLYDKDSIQSISPRAHIQKRSGMYIGDTSDSTQLVVELFSNALDEVNIGHGNVIKVEIDTHLGKVVVEDEGQGFPVNQVREDGETILQASFDVINTSGKYTDDGVYGGVSLGLNGVGSKACCFLSDKLIVETRNNGKSEKILFEDGFFEKRVLGRVPETEHGTRIEMYPSAKYFDSALPNTTSLRKMFDDIAGMCPHLTIEFDVNGKLEHINHPDGMKYLIDSQVGKDAAIVSSPLLIQEKKDRYSFDCGLSYTNRSSSRIIAYVNYGLTEQGPHITTLKTCLTRVLNKWGKEQGVLKEKEANLDGNALQEGLVLVFNLVSPGISYDAQTKAKIISKDYVPFLNDTFSVLLEKWLDTNPQDGKTIIEKALLARRASEAAKKAREAVKKKAEKKDKVFKLPTSLVDAWTKDRSKAELLICEGK